MTARPVRHNAQVLDRNGKIFYTSITSLSHISKEKGVVVKMNCSPSSRQLKKYKFFLPVEIICWQFYAACK